MTVYTSEREFPSIQDLIATATPELDGGLTTDAMQTYWWYSEHVRFETNTSSGMVEVQGQSVLIGYPAHYKTYRFEDGESALHWAWDQHQKWVEWQSVHAGPDDWREFVNQSRITAPPIAIWVSRYPHRISSRQQLAATIGWDAEGQRVANVWNLLTQGKGVLLMGVLPAEETPSQLRLLPSTIGPEPLDLPTTADKDVIDLTQIYV